MASTMLHVRMDEDIKAQGTAALAAIGLSTADAVRILFHRIVADQAFPLELKVPNAKTSAAMEESRQLMQDMKAGRAQARFKNAEEMFASLERGE